MTQDSKPATKAFHVGQGVRWGSEYWTVVGHSSQGESVKPSSVATAIERFGNIRIVPTHELSNADTRF